MFNYLTHTFDNGLRLVFVPMATTSVTVELLVKVGSKNESPKIRGLSHFLEHMAFKGTPKRPNTITIARELDKVGAVYNASTSGERISYWIKTTPENLELSLDIIADIVFNPLLPEKEIKKEKGVILEEINMYEDSPMEKVWDVFSRSVFGDNPLGWEVIGEKETVLSLTRNDFVEYMNRFYSPSNMVLAIAGGIKKNDFKKLVSLVNKWFGKEKKKELPPVKIEWSFNDKKELIKTKKTEQTHFILGVPCFSLFDPRRYQAMVLQTVLGGTMSSRLFIKIRERKGWAYYIHAVADHMQEAGVFAVAAGVRNDKFSDAVNLIKKEMVTIAETITKKEVEEAKLNSRGRLLLALESSTRVAGLVGESWLLKGEIEKAEEILAMIEKVTKDDLVKLGEEFFKEDKFYLGAIGPINK